MIPTKRCGLSQEHQKKLRSVFAKKTGIEKVLLYGSRAKGNFKPGSDIDLTVQAPKLSFNDLLSMQNEIDDLMLPYKVDLSLFHLIDNSEVIDHIIRWGIEFYPNPK